MRKLFLLICLSVLFAYCSKDPIDPTAPVVDPPAGGVVVSTDTVVPAPIDTPTGTPPQALLRKITQDGKTNTEFTYNSKWQLVKIISYLSPGMISSQKIHYYDYTGLLVRIDNYMNISSTSTVVRFDSSYSRLFYDANKRVTEIRTYRLRKGLPEFASRTVPEYDAKGRMITGSIYADSVTSQFSYKTTYEYNMQDNVVKCLQFHSGFMSGTSAKFTEVFEYDQQKNPYRGIWPGVYGISVNNLIKTVTTNHLVTPNTFETTVSNIKTYNAQGFPTLVHDANGLDYVYTYYQ